MPAHFPVRYQSVCRWSFHAGKGGFVPSGIRPALAGLTPVEFARLVAEKVAPRVPSNTRLGLAVHYDREIDESTAAPFREALLECGLCISMITPGAHYHWGYGGIGSPDPVEREGASRFCRRAMDLLLGPLWEAQDPACPAAFDIWNGSFGYEIPTPLVADMLSWADDSIAGLLEHAARSGRKVPVGVEPKPNEGHPAMLYQTSGEVLALRGRLARRGLDVSSFGLVNEFGHTEMAGLDLVQEYAAAAAEGAIVHVHANSQGGDGVRLGGSGKFDIDYGVSPSAASLSIASILSRTGYGGWIEHDMQPRPYDDAGQNVNRVVRSICTWEAVARTVEGGALDVASLAAVAASRDSMALEDIVRDAVCEAHALSKQLYSEGSR
jgi:xylose isomerase